MSQLAAQNGRLAKRRCNPAADCLFRASPRFSTCCPSRTVTPCSRYPKKAAEHARSRRPDEKLKLLQHKLSIVLQDCLDEINAQKAVKRTVAHGFKRKCSVVSNAAEHHHRRWVFNLDLKDFFPSINFGRVRGFFIKDKNFLLDKNVATILAQIACDGTALPQGSPCSPVISNLIAHVMDMHIVRVSKAVGCTHSRYADDLTFSTSKPAFPEDIARRSETDTNVWVPGDKLAEIIAHSGFFIKLKIVKHRTSSHTISVQFLYGTDFHRASY